MFKVSVVARNIKDESLVSPLMEVLVDTGSELTWLPKDLLTGIGVKPVRKRSFTTATKQMVTRETGYVIVSAEGFETVDEVVLVEPGDMSLLGVRTLEGFGVMVDNIAHRIVAWFTLSQAIVNLILSIVLVQRFGIEGVALAPRFRWWSSRWLRSLCISKSTLTSRWGATCGARCRCRSRFKLRSWRCCC